MKDQPLLHPVALLDTQTAAVNPSQSIPPSVNTVASRSDAIDVGPDVIAFLRRHGRWQDGMGAKDFADFLHLYPSLALNSIPETAFLVPKKAERYLRALERFLLSTTVRNDPYVKECAGRLTFSFPTPTMVFLGMRDESDGTGLFVTRLIGQGLDGERFTHVSRLSTQWAPKLYPVLTEIFNQFFSGQWRPHIPIDLLDTTTGTALLLQEVRWRGDLLQWLDDNGHDDAAAEFRDQLLFDLSPLFAMDRSTAYPYNLERLSGCLLEHVASPAEPVSEVGRTIGTEIQRMYVAGDLPFDQLGPCGAELIEKLTGKLIRQGRTLRDGESLARLLERRGYSWARSEAEFGFRRLGSYELRKPFSPGQIRSLDRWARTAGQGRCDVVEVEKELEDVLGKSSSRRPDVLALAYVIARPDLSPMDRVCFLLERLVPRFSGLVDLLGDDSDIMVPQLLSDLAARVFATPLVNPILRLFDSEVFLGWLRDFPDAGKGLLCRALSDDQGGRSFRRSSVRDRIAGRAISALSVARPAVALELFERFPAPRAAIDDVAAILSGRYRGGSLPTWSLDLDGLRAPVRMQVDCAAIEEYLGNDCQALAHSLVMLGNSLCVDVTGLEDLRAISDVATVALNSMPEVLGDTRSDDLRALLQRVSDLGGHRQPSSRLGPAVEDLRCFFEDHGFLTLNGSVLGGTDRSAEWGGMPFFLERVAREESVIADFHMFDRLTEETNPRELGTHLARTYLRLWGAAFLDGDQLRPVPEEFALVAEPENNPDSDFIVPEEVASLFPPLDEGVGEGREETPGTQPQASDAEVFGPHCKSVRPISGRMDPSHPERGRLVHLLPAHVSHLRTGTFFGPDLNTFSYQRVNHPGFRGLMELCGRNEGVLDAESSLVILGPTTDFGVPLPVGGQIVEVLSSSGAEVPWVTSVDGSVATEGLSPSEAVTIRFRHSSDQIPLLRTATIGEVREHLPRWILSKVSPRSELSQFPWMVRDLLSSITHNTPAAYAARELLALVDLAYPYDNDVTLKLEYKEFENTTRYVLEGRRNAHIDVIHAIAQPGMLGGGNCLQRAVLLQELTAHIGLPALYSDVVYLFRGIHSISANNSHSSLYGFFISVENQLVFRPIDPNTPQHLDDALPAPPLSRRTVFSWESATVDREWDLEKLSPRRRASGIAPSLAREVGISEDHRLDLEELLRCLSSTAPWHPQSETPAKSMDLDQLVGNAIELLLAVDARSSQAARPQSSASPDLLARLMAYATDMRRTFGASDDRST